MADLLRVSIQGAMPGGEEWSVNPVYNVGSDFGTPVSAAQASTIATAIAAVVMPSGLTATMNSSCNWNSVRVEARTLDGTLESLGEAAKGTPTPGTGTANLPFQSALVSSLRTATAGASGRGRLYWNATGLSVNGTTLRVAGATLTPILAAVKTYLSAINAAIDVTLDGVSLCVWSRVKQDLYPVNSIQMGDVVDVQRRRRDAAPEAYQTVSFP